MSSLKFGVLTFPIHRPEHNPTLQLQEDLELVEHCDRIGFDEFWWGEHHSGGWQIISSPELMVAAAARRTSRIRLGTGVSTLSYHHPLTLLNRIIQLDHLTRGRLIFGVGAGALALDSTMIGHDPMHARRMMTESLEVIFSLLRHGGPVSAETDWFAVKDAYLQLMPFGDELDIRVAAFRSPTGPVAAGRFGAGMLSFGASAAVGAGSENPMNTAWQHAEEAARAHGQQISRSQWSVMSPVHVANTDREARDQVRWGLPHYVKYLRQILPMNLPVDLDDVDAVVDLLHTVGHGVIGTPDRAVAHIRKLQEITGGFGTFVIEHGDLALPEHVRRSTEVFMREVVPHFTDAAEPRLAAHRREVSLDGFTRRTMASAQARASVEQSLNRIAGHR